MHVDEIGTYVCQYLTLSEYRNFSLACRRFHQLAIEILKQEADFFGGDKKQALSYFKNLCTLIRSSRFPEELRIRKEQTLPSRKRIKGPIHYRETLLNLCLITLSECHLLYSMCDKAENFYSIIQHSPLWPGLPLRIEQINFLLYRAAQHGHSYLTGKLIHNGADPNGLVSGKTPFHAAILSGNEELTSLFLFHNANPNKRDSLSNSPLLLAASINHLGIAILLLDQGAREDFHPSSIFPSAMHYCLMKNQTKMAKAIRARTNILVMRDRHGGTYLHMAMSFKQDWMLENLNPAPMLNGQDRHLNTPLHIAMQNQYEFGIRFLARHRAVYDVENLAQETAISLCPEPLKPLFNY